MNASNVFALAAAVAVGAVFDDEAGVDFGLGGGEAGAAAARVMWAMTSGLLW